MGNSKGTSVVGAVLADLQIERNFTLGQFSNMLNEAEHSDFSEMKIKVDDLIRKLSILENKIELISGFLAQLAKKDLDKQQSQQVEK